MSDDRSTVDDQQVIGRDRVVTDKSAKADKGLETMQVKVHSPFREYYAGLATSMTAENATGTFDILPQHHNFISLLLPCDLIIRTASAGELKLQISGGLCHVKADRTTVFLDI